MLDNNEAVSVLDELVEDVEEASDIVAVQAGCGLIKEQKCVTSAPCIGSAEAGEVCDEFESLGLSPGERVEGLP